MKVLVTGSRGYIGAVLVPLLQDAGHEVIGIDADFFRACTWRFHGSRWQGDRVTRVGDVRDIEPSDLVGVQAICHLAGLSNDAMGDLDARLTQEINCEASIRLAEMAKAAGVERFLFASSCSNYGVNLDEAATERSLLNPLTPYAVSKVRVEEALQEMSSADFCPVSNADEWSGKNHNTSI